jgi:hypothetical protein
VAVLTHSTAEVAALREPLRPWGGQLRCNQSVSLGSRCSAEQECRIWLCTMQQA